MGLFGKKKKGKKKDKKKGSKAAPTKPAEKPSEESVIEGLPEKPDWLRSSSVELKEVETAIDLKADAQSRSNILARYEEKYGETLEAPEFSAGLRYEYQLYEEGDVVTKRDLSFLEEGEEKEAEAEVKAEGDTPKKEKRGFFARKDKKDKKVKAADVEGKEAEPEGPVVPAKPSFLDPDKEVDWGKGAVMCIVLGKPMWPLTGLVKYKAREKKGWMNAIILLDLITIAVPVSILMWRLWFRIGYEVFVRAKRKKEMAALEEPEETEEAPPKKKSKKKATKA